MQRSVCDTLILQGQALDSPGPRTWLTLTLSFTLWGSGGVGIKGLPWKHLLQSRCPCQF